MSRCTFSTPEVATPECTVEVLPHPLPTTAPEALVETLPLTGSSLVQQLILVGVLLVFGILALMLARSLDPQTKENQS